MVSGDQKWSDVYYYIFSLSVTTVEIHAFVPIVCVGMIVLFSNVIAIILSQGVLNAMYCSCYLDKHKRDAKTCSYGVTSIKNVQHLGCLSASKSY